ncbi:hypothetical protein [Sulfuriferula nivalis]|uniref:Lipoprotein n=1 Tax=Sulfuriferula nivalis TaxID=2675298 RepID=A0A809SC23_9PROT|nr:hypothetical protein [Sulfuriferula nivalis]BBO99606.1 hypothetical protein SFSGTM_03150 [Sulfuriferula nivalis]
MHKYTIKLSIIILMLSGCTSVPPKITPITEQNIQTSKGDFEELWNAWIKPQINWSEPGVGSGVAVSTQKEVNSTEQSIMDGFHRFCSSMNGITASTEQKFGYKSICTTATGDYLGAVSTSRYLAYNSHSRFAGIVISFDSKSIAEKRQEEKSALAAIEDEKQYRLLSAPILPTAMLSQLIEKFKNNDPDNLIPKAKERLAALISEQKKQMAEQEAQQTRQAAAAASLKLWHQEHRHIGDQICNVAGGTYDEYTGIVSYGKGEYRKIEGINRIVGFVENISGKRIQIRISGINFTGLALYGRKVDVNIDELHNFNGGSSLKINNIIWDDIYNWNDC